MPITKKILNWKKPKFDHLILESDKFLIYIGHNGIMLTKMCGSGDEKDCDVELSWDEIFDMGQENSSLPSKATIDFLGKMAAVEALNQSEELLKVISDDLCQCEEGKSCKYHRVYEEVKQAIKQVGSL